MAPGPCRRTVGLGPGGVAAGIWDTVTVPVSAHAKVASCPALLAYLNGVINISIGIGNGRSTTRKSRRQRTRQKAHGITVHHHPVGTFGIGPYKIGG